MHWLTIPIQGGPEGISHMRPIVHSHNAELDGRKFQGRTQEQSDHSLRFQPAITAGDTVFMQEDREFFCR